MDCNWGQVQVPFSAPPPKSPEAPVKGRPRPVDRTRAKAPGTILSIRRDDSPESPKSPADVPGRISVGSFPPDSRRPLLRQLSFGSVLSGDDSPEKRGSRVGNRVAEAESCVSEARLHLSNSRNLKTEIKNGVLRAIERLLELVREGDAVNGGGSDASPASAVRPTRTSVPLELHPIVLEGVLAEHKALLTSSMAQMRTLSKLLKKQDVVGGANDGKELGTLVSEVKELRQATEETGRRVSSLQETVPSYAEVLARPIRAIPDPQPSHSIIVSSSDVQDNSEKVLDKVRMAIEARASGIQLTRVQKVRNRKLVLSCANKEELTRVKERIAAKGSLAIEEARCRDPLVVIKNLLSYNTDEEIVASLRSQNKGILGNLRDEEFRAIIKYRRKARNPLETNVVVQVSPKMWQRLTEAGRIHVDLQYVQVQDQSPLVQCTRCLGYGHGRRQCREPVDLCSHCAGPHLRGECPVRAAGETVTCRNCRLAKHDEIGHSVFDAECPIRKRWDALARASVAYC